jgi:transglutaminase-like putative cysteine protease
MVVYHDMNDFNPLYWCRQCPPHENYQFTSALSKLEFDITQIIYRTYILFANEKSLVSKPIKMHPGQMLVCRRGQLVWNSHEKIMIHSSEKIDEQFLTQNHKKKITPSYLYKKESNKDSIILNVSHITKYTYEKPVELSKHYFRLHPVNDKYQELMEYRLQLSVPSQSETFDDVFGNRVTLLEIDHPYNELIVTMKAKLNVSKYSELKRSILHTRSKIPLLWMPWQRQMMLPYLLPPELPESQLGELTDFAMSFVVRNDHDVIDSLVDINQTIYRDFKYKSGSTNLETTPFDVFLNRYGVCQDFSNLFICLARLMGIPARYRVGYIFTGADYANKKQSEASHAWVEIYLPWLGWRGFDPTNGCLISQDHIRVACGRNYFDATPTSGTLFKGGGKEGLTVHVKVERK